MTPMLLPAIFTVATMAALFFGLGLAIGHARGRRQARVEALNTCIDLAGMVRRGHPLWHGLKADAALLKAGTLIGGNALVPLVRKSSCQPFAKTAPAATYSIKFETADGRLIDPPPVGSVALTTIPQFTKGSQV